MTVNTSKNDNVVFFFVSDLKIDYDNNYQSLITKSWTKRKTISCVTTYLETKSFKIV